MNYGFMPASPDYISLMWAIITKSAAMGAAMFSFSTKCLKGSVMKILILLSILAFSKKSICIISLCNNHYHDYALYQPNKIGQIHKSFL